MLPTTNITTTLVGNTLGVSTRKVSELCTSALINKWSLYKPIDYDKSSGLTDADYFAADFGYTISSQNSYISLKNAISLNKGWDYNKPRGGKNSPYRLGDFRKYDHSAKELFTLTLNSSFQIGGNLQIGLPTDIMWLTNWGQWSSFQGTNIQYLNCGFYVPTVGYYPLTDTNQGLTIADLDMDKLNVPISAGYFTVGKSYSVYLILTTWDGLNGPRQWYNPSDTETGTWWYLPSSTPASFTVKALPTPFDFIHFIGDGTADMSYTNGYYQWRNVKLNYDITVDSNYPYSTGTLYMEVIISNNYSGSGTTTSPKTIYTLNLTDIVSGYSYSRGNVVAQNFNQLTSKEDVVNANISLRLTVGGTTYTSNNMLPIYPN